MAPTTPRSIGVSAYFPLVEGASPTRRQLVAAWEPIVVRLGALSHRWQRRVVFTEIGYPAADGGAWRPWEVPGDARENRELQAEAFAAFLEAVWPQPWLGGAYWWKWFSGGDGDREGDPFAFRGRPAAAILQRAWAKRP
jgi:hypothetical protein